MKELRIGLVLYGGVSLAVYMNGVATEIWNALRASVARNPNILQAKGTAAVYRKLMDDLKQCEDCSDLRIVVDTIAGTSAGGVNGLVLGKAIATGANASVLNKTWIEKAGIEKLKAKPPMRTPWKLRVGDWVLARFWSDYRKLRRFLDNTSGIDWRWARNHIFSLFASDDPENTPLRGDYFTKMVASTLEEMTDGHAGPKLIPPGGRLDLILTRTDLYGWPRHLPVDPRFHDDLLETAHAHQMQFRFHRPLNRSHKANDHDFNDDFSLTYAARTTAGFPVAFAPVSYRSAAKSFTKARHGEPFPDSDTFAARHLPEHHLAAYKAETAWMVDGGILDNKPFSAAIKLIEEKPANRAIYRTLIYVEPDPALVEFARPAPIPLPRRMPSLLYKLFRHEPIFADLHTVDARNRLVRRLIQIAAAAKAHGERVMHAELAGPLNDLERLRASANDELRTGNNPSYPGYAMLKARRAADTLAGSISEALGYPYGSKHGYFIREVVRDFFRRKGAFDSPEFDIETQAYISKPSQIALLRAFDMPYRLRRIRYLVYVANDRYRKSKIENGELAALDAFKGALMQVAFAFDELNTWGCGHGEEIRQRLAQVLDLDDLDAFIGAYADKPCKFAGTHFQRIEVLYRWMRRYFNRTMNYQGQAVRDAILNLPKPLCERLAKAYVVYPMVDVAIFPMMDSRGVRDLSTTRVFRISPHDATALSKDPRRLKGREFGAFAGFLRRDSREHDLLWGRLDGAERLIDLIMTAAYNGTRTHTKEACDGTQTKETCDDTQVLPDEVLNLRTKYLKAAFKEILDQSERGASTQLRKVIADVRKKMPV